MAYVQLNHDDGQVPDHDGFDMNEERKSSSVQPSEILLFNVWHGSPILYVLSRD